MDGELVVHVVPHQPGGTRVQRIGRIEERDDHARVEVDRIIAAVRDHWAEAAAFAQLTSAEQDRMMGRRFLNPGTLRDAAPVLLAPGFADREDGCSRMDGVQTPIEDTLPEVPDDVDAVTLAEVVAELAEMNSDDWSTFVAAGYTAEARVEFAFSAPHEQAARSLAEDLADEAAYEVGAGEPGGELEDWVVTGATPGVTVTEAGLRTWVDRLAAYGLDHDGCVLDGWAVVLD